MGFETWKREFYPVPANQAVGSEREALEHSLTKWIGLRRSNLYRHGLMEDRMGRGITDGEFGFNVDASTCALCERHSMVCDQCSLTKANGGFSCDGIDCRDDGGESMVGPNPYGKFVNDGNPEPMIDLILKAIEEQSK